MQPHNYSDQEWETKLWQCGCERCKRSLELVDNIRKELTLKIEGLERDIDNLDEEVLALHDKIEEESRI